LLLSRIQTVIWNDAASPSCSKTDRASQGAAGKLGMVDNDIGLALGFRRRRSFSAAFRDATGLSATEYRRTQQ
jgi:methylphosphotriester-DNA--protein-cysteine methyltransferase